MADFCINEFVMWYLNREGYEKTASSVEKSIGIKNKKPSKKKIKKFRKILKNVRQEDKDWVVNHRL